MDDAMECLISFSDFLYAFQVQFYYEGMDPFDNFFIIISVYMFSKSHIKLQIYIMYIILHV